MSRITYVPKKFSADHQAIIDQANVICADYQQQGYDLTLRQLYYQFVARALIPNRDTEYKRLGDIISQARLAGQLDWDYITDRTRNLRGLTRWNDPGSIVRAAWQSYHIEWWATQPEYVEVWIEKDALVGVVQQACDPLDVSYFSCRGYTSQSEVWAAAMRLAGKVKQGKIVTVIHLGDHDPSGIDMTRDITDRLDMFTRGMVRRADITINRIALTMAQIQQYNPPPNPAKLTDSRSSDYVANYGTDSWELDALDPAVMDALIRDEIDLHIDQVAWDDSEAREREEKALLEANHEHWTEVQQFLQDNGYVDGYRP